MRRFVALAALSALVGGLMYSGPARAQLAGPLTVQVGSFVSEVGEGMRFYAPTLRVEPGQVVKFQSEGFHTATLLPADTDVHAWAADNVSGIGKPYSLAVPDPDDNTEAGGTAQEPALKANNAVLLPSDFTCGGSTPCDYNGNSVVNSGLPTSGPLDFSVEINAQPGETVWVICLIHPHMRLRIEVVSDAAEASTQEDIDEFFAAWSAFDADWAAAKHEVLKNKRSSHMTESGRVWDSWVGYDNHWVTLYAMYPLKLRVRKGDTVRYHFDGLVYEDHTATFPASLARAEAQNTFVPGCDPDGDEGAGPDGPPENEVTICNNPANIEFDIQPDFAYERGDGIFRGSDYENSGVRGASFAPRVDSWDLRFARRSGDKPFKYICLIHPFMLGKVVVR